MAFMTLYEGLLEAQKNLQKGKSELNELEQLLLSRKNTVKWFVSRKQYKVRQLITASIKRKIKDISKEKKNVLRIEKLNYVLTKEKNETESLEDELQDVSMEMEKINRKFESISLEDQLIDITSEINNEKIEFDKYGEQFKTLTALNNAEIGSNSTDSLFRLLNGMQNKFFENNQIEFVTIQGKFNVNKQQIEENREMLSKYIHNRDFLDYLNNHETIEKNLQKEKKEVESENKKLNTLNAKKDNLGKKLAKKSENISLIQHQINDIRLKMPDSMLESDDILKKCQELELDIDAYLSFVDNFHDTESANEAADQINNYINEINGLINSIHLDTTSRFSEIDKYDSDSLENKRSECAITLQKAQNSLSPLADNIGKLDLTSFKEGIREARIKVHNSNTIAPMSSLMDIIESEYSKISNQINNTYWEITGKKMYWRNGVTYPDKFIQKTPKASPLPESI